MQHSGAKGDCQDYSQLVPLYNKETHILDFKKRIKTKSTMKLSSAESFVSSLVTRKTNSYLDQFRAKKVIVPNNDDEMNCSCKSSFSNHSSYHCDESITGSICYNMEEASVYNMKSVSEYSLQLNSSLRKKKQNNLSIRPIINAPLKLGGLGPDTELCKEKMERLKRQQSYGQKVSNHNRMKIIERQVIKNLDEELKRSNEIDKCVKNVLIKSN